MLINTPDLGQANQQVINKFCGIVSKLKENAENQQLLSYQS